MSRRHLSPAATVAFILLIPLAIPTLFLVLEPSAERARAQELAPKHAFAPPTRTESKSTKSGTTARRAVNARTRAKDSAVATPQKPAGKMEFYSDSATSRTNRLPTPGRSAADTVARRQVPNQPAKIAATRRAPSPPTRRTTSPVIDTSPTPVPEPVVEAIVEATAEPASEPAPVPVAKLDEENDEWETPLPRAMVEEPEAVAQSEPESPARFRERPEASSPDFELPIVRTPARPKKMLDEEVEEAIAADEPSADEGDDLERKADMEMKAVRPGGDVVHLYFEEDAPVADDASESMDLVEREPNEEKDFAEPAKPLDLLTESAAERDRMSEDRRPIPVETLAETVIEPAPASEIQNVAVQEPSLEEKPTNAAVTQVDDVPPLSNDILAELKPVRSIEIRKAVEVPALAETDNPQLREPVDQAGAMLRKRPPLKFWPVYRDPWTANRDSFAFHHNPLWFEDPNLERCGRGTGHFSSVCSFLQFNTNIAFLPYRMTAEPWHSCVRTLPDCTVCQKFGHDAYLPPWSWRAAAVQAGCIVGFIYAIP